MSRLTPGMTALVTGASSGLGVEFASRLARRGLHLVLVARREDRLQALADRLRADTGVTVTVIAQDLSTPDAAETLTRTLDKLSLSVDVLVNNAGFGMNCDFVDADPAVVDEMIRLNIGTLTALTRTFSARMRESSRGTIVNIASMAALAPVVHMAAYAATKAYVLNFSQAIAAELEGTGVTVIAVSPGPARTEFFDIAGGNVGGDRFYLTAGRVVGDTIRALDRQHAPSNVIPGVPQRLLAGIAQVLPRWLLVMATDRAMR